MQMDTPKRQTLTRRWGLLLVYNIYRIVTLGVFLGLFLYSPSKYISPLMTYSFLFVYFLIAILFLYLWYHRIPRFELQVLLSGLIDIPVITTMLSLIGSLQSGFGILLNFFIAALSILVPGRLAIFFAALASCLLLSGALVQYAVEESKALNTLFYSGVYGAGFFATAITAWYLANWIKISENLAKQRAKQLLELQRINEYIVGRLHFGVIYTNLNKSVKMINYAAKQFFGIPLHQTVDTLNELSTKLDEKCSNFIAHISQRERMVQSHLDEPPLRIHFISTMVADDPAILIILDEIKEITQQAQQLKLASLGRFSASIAHELRNPLGVIAHAVQLLGEDNQISIEDARLKQLIINNCNRMNEVIKNVLQISRREQSKPELIKIGSFLRQFKKEFCLSKPCDITINLPKGDKTKILFDKSQLEQVLIILCENALQHGQDEQGQVKITLESGINNNQMMIKIKDKGKGIDPAIRESIFEPFYTTLASGTGMGLFIAKDLCEINQARLCLLDSTEGSCFAIIIGLSTELLL